jgi:hypothetical protein
MYRNSLKQPPLKLILYSRKPRKHNFFEFMIHWPMPHVDHAACGFGYCNLNFGDINPIHGRLTPMTTPTPQTRPRSPVPLCKSPSPSLRLHTSTLSQAPQLERRCDAGRRRRAGPAGPPAQAALARLGQHRPRVRLRHRLRCRPRRRHRRRHVLIRFSVLGLVSNFIAIISLLWKFVVHCMCVFRYFPWRRMLSTFGCAFGCNFSFEAGVAFGCVDNIE